MWTKWNVTNGLIAAILPVSFIHGALFGGRGSSGQSVHIHARRDQHRNASAALKALEHTPTYQKRKANNFKELLTPLKLDSFQVRSDIAGVLNRCSA